VFGGGAAKAAGVRRRRRRERRPFDWLRVNGVLGMRFF
jgi:hypothetical protein